MSSLFDPGKDDRNAAAAAAQKGVITGSSFSGPGGLGGNFDFSNGHGSFSGELGAFQSSMDNMLAASQQGFSQATGGLPPEMLALAGQTMDGLGAVQTPESMLNRNNFQGFQDVFNANQKTAVTDPFDLGSTISDKLRQLDERKNQKLVNKTFDRLKASGKLGTTGGAGIAAELDANLFDQGLKHDLAGFGAGMDMRNQAFGMMQGANQGMEGIAGRNFAEGMAKAGFDKDTIMKQYGVGANTFDQFLKNQLQGMNIGMAGSTGAAGIAQLPLSMQQAIMGLSTSASNSNFAMAGVHGQNAANAKSPFLEALNAAGSFVGNVMPGGFGGGGGDGTGD